MQNYQIATKELILKQNSRNAGIETFVYEPASIEEEVLGNLYIIGWLENHRQDLAFIPNLVASAVRREFYKTKAGADAAMNFELSIQKANETLKDISKTNKNIQEDIGLCVVNIAHDKIRLTSIGKCAMFLFRDRETIPLGEKSKKKKESNGFGSIITGSIEEQDRFIFSTWKLMDLFSEAGIAKLFQLPQDNQAEIITKIYQKNSKEISLPDQAAVLLEIKTQKAQGLLAFAKTIRAKSNITTPQVKSIVSLETVKTVMQKVNPVKAIRKISLVRLHRNAMLLFGAVLVVVAITFAGITVHAKYAIFEGAHADFLRAEEILRSHKHNAITLLQHARETAFPLLSVWYVRDDAQTLLMNINRDINKANGIYIDPPVRITSLSYSSLQFTPRYIFDDMDSVYVFGKSPDMFYKVEKETGKGYFTFATVATTTESNRALQREDGIYFVNDAAHLAWILSLTDKKVTPVVKTLKKTLVTASAQNKRDMADATYALSPEKNKIIKQSKLGNVTETFLLGAMQNTLDFTVSADNKYIFLLTSMALFAVQNSQ